MIGNVLLALRVVVDPADGTVELIEADVIEALKAGPRNAFHAMVGHQKVFLPSHK